MQGSVIKLHKLNKIPVYNLYSLYSTVVSKKHDYRSNRYFATLVLILICSRTEYDPYAYHDDLYIDEEPIYVPRSVMADIIHKVRDHVC